jgi:hypothetical protein
MPPVGARSVAAPLRPLFGWSISTTTGPAALATGKEADGWESASCRSPRLESVLGILSSNIAASPPSIGSDLRGRPGHKTVPRSKADMLRDQATRPVVDPKRPFDFRRK